VFEGGDGLWNNPNEGATNVSGFSAIPAGVRSKNLDSQGVYLGGSKYASLGNFCYFGSQTFRSNTAMFSTSLAFSTSNFGLATNQRTSGFSIRCLKD
jgi:uncharacterized protein (TIGR02145 family)